MSEETLLGDPCIPSSRTGVKITSIRQSTSARVRSRHSMERQTINRQFCSYKEKNELYVIAGRPYNLQRHLLHTYHPQSTCPYYHHHVI